MIVRPLQGEYNPTVERYIELVPEGNLLDTLLNRHDYTLSLLGELSEEHGNFQYALAKWSLKTVIGHISDVERLWSYRILRMARGDVRELPGYDRDIFANNAPYNRMSLKDTLNDYSAVRTSTMTLLTYLDEEETLRKGMFTDHTLTVRAAAYILAGHDIHHMRVVEEKYMGVPL